MMRISIKTSTLLLEGDMSKGAKFVMYIIVSIETRLWKYIREEVCKFCNVYDGAVFETIRISMCIIGETECYT